MIPINTSRRGSTASTATKSSASAALNNNNKKKDNTASNNQQQQQHVPTPPASTSPTTPQAIINSALTHPEQDDFRHAFWHHFRNTTSPVPLTITTRELGFIFKAFGQKVPEPELRHIVNKYGISVQQAAMNHNVFFGGGSSNSHQIQQNLGSSAIFLSQSGQFGPSDLTFANNNNNNNQRQQILASKPSFILENNNNNPASRPSTQQNIIINNNNFQVVLQRAGSSQMGGTAGTTNVGSLPGTANMKVLTWTQFMLIMAEKLKSGDSVQVLEDAFDVFDVKGVGFVTSKDLRQFMTLLGDSRLSESEVEQMIQEADVDGDGTIDKDEFIKMLQK